MLGTASLGEAVLRTRLDNTGLQTGLGQAKRGLNRDLDQMGARLDRFGKRASIGLTLPILAIGGASIKAASDAEETQSKFQVVFRSIGNEAEAAAERLEDSFGLSSQSARQLLGDTGDLLTGFGFSQAAALDLSTQVNELAVDLASFTNVEGGAERASAALTKALLGEREGVKSLGIAILEADVQAQVLANTQAGLTFETERQAKAYATLQIAQRQSKNAMGDYERTSDSAANQTRLLAENTEDLRIALGRGLLPIYTPLVAGLADAAEGFADMNEGQRTAILVSGGVVAATGPVLIGLGQIVTIAPKVATGLKAIRLAALPLFGPVGLLIGAGAVLVALGVAYDNHVNGPSRRLLESTQDLIDKNRAYRDDLIVTTEAQRTAAVEQLNIQKEQLRKEAEILERQLALEIQKRTAKAGRFDQFSDPQIAQVASPEGVFLTKLRRQVNEIGTEIAAIDTQITEISALELTVTPPPGGTPNDPYKAVGDSAETAAQKFERLARAQSDLSNVPRAVLLGAGIAAPTDLNEAERIRRDTELAQARANGLTTIGERIQPQLNQNLSLQQQAALIRADTELAQRQAERAALEAQLAANVQAGNQAMQDRAAAEAIAADTEAAQRAAVVESARAEMARNAALQEQAALIRVDTAAAELNAAIGARRGLNSFSRDFFGSLTPERRAFNNSLFQFRPREGDGGLEEAEQIRETQIAAADKFAETVLSAGVGFANAIASGDPRQIVSGAFGAAGSILGGANLGSIPFLGGSLGIGAIMGGVLPIFGSLFGSLFGGGQNEAERAREEAARRTRSVPAININFRVDQTNNYNGGPRDPQNEQAFRRQASVMFEEFYTRTLGPRLDRLENALGI